MPDPNPAAIKARVEGRKAAHEIHGLLEWPRSYKRQWSESFLDQLRTMLIGKIEPPTLKQRWSYHHLASTRMPFGAYEGQPLEQVPTDDLDYLCRELEAFYEKLRAYLRHPDRPTE